MKKVEKIIVRMERMLDELQEDIRESVGVGCTEACLSRLVKKESPEALATHFDTIMKMVAAGLMRSKIDNERKKLTGM